MDGHVWIYFRHSYQHYRSVDLLYNVVGNTVLYLLYSIALCMYILYVHLHVGACCMFQKGHLIR